MVQQNIAARSISAMREWRQRDWLAAYIFLAPAAAIFAALIAYPFADGIATSFTDRAVAQPGSFIGFDNFAKLMTDEHFLGAAMNSLVLTVCVVTMKLILGLASAASLIFLGAFFPVVLATCSGGSRRSTSSSAQRLREETRSGAATAGAPASSAARASPAG